jgi:hypothetical protein
MRPNDGSLIDVSLVVSGVYHGRGALLARSSVICDITEWTKAEREQSMLAAIVASSEDAIITKVPDRTNSTWNSGAENSMAIPRRTRLAGRCRCWFRRIGVMSSIR